ncbi:MAG: ferric reductase-like transmembrane domain-containing protein [Waddliaceae bacterium]
MNNFLSTRSRLSFLLAIIAGCLFTGIWILTTQKDWIDSRLFRQLKGVGSGIGVAGYFLFSLSLFLSSRWSRLEDCFGGLDKIYHIHHQLGIWGFVLILIHPWVIAAKWIPHRLDKFFTFLFPVHDRWSVNLGSVAFWLMIFIIGVTILKVFPYDKWKITHQFMSLVFLFASYHVLFSEKKISSSLFPHLLLYIPFLMGLFGVFYKQIFIPLFAKHPLFEVVKTRYLNDNIIEIDLVPREEKLTYIPGQYAFFRFHGEKLSKESHPFTFTGPPNESKISILVKSRGDYTRSLYQHVKEGFKANLEGPFGRFDFTKTGKEQIWIAGGIGIAPFIAWVRALKFSENDRVIDLFYSFHRKQDAVFVEEFAQASRTLPHFRYFLFCSEEHNRLNAKEVMDLSNNLQEKDILMCGPRRLTEDLSRQLTALGVKRKNILFEDFEFF